MCSEGGRVLFSGFGLSLCSIDDESEFLALDDSLTKNPDLFVLRQLGVLLTTVGEKESGYREKKNPYKKRIHGMEEDILKKTQDDSLMVFTG